MLFRNAAQTQMGAPVSGTISSATAQGYLPPYRGSAAASLAPTMANVPTFARDGSDRYMSKGEMSYGSVGVSPLNAASFLPENLPLIGNRLRRPTPPPADSMGAERYMRYLTQKDVAEQRGAAEKNLNSNTSGTGPASGSGW